MSELPPLIPSGWTPPADQRPAPVETFTHSDALAWLGITPEAYERACRAGKGLGPGEIGSAILDARAANSAEPCHAQPLVVTGETTAEEILARYEIDPQRPEVSVAAWLVNRSRYWS